VIAGEGMPIQTACRVLDVSESGFYDWRSRPPSIRQIRHVWLTDLITQIHTASRGVYGANRVHADRFRQDRFGGPRLDIPRK